jgi:class 3 adenylate cyclase
MEQQIRFCTTSDGVRIAYASMGQGPPLVRVLGWCTHLEFEQKFPGWEQSTWALLSRKHQFVRYDGRGMGLSDRNVDSFSLDDKVRDLEAVIDAMELPRVALLGTSEGGPTAIAYAVLHPERVSHLILYGSFAWRSLPESDEDKELLRAMMMTVIPGWGRDTPEFRQLWTFRFVPEANREEIRWFNELQKVSAKGETVAALIGAIGRIDVRDLLPQVKTPTLVIHRRGDIVCPFDLGRELAALIPGARLVPLEGSNHFPLSGEPELEQLVLAVEEFVAEGQEEPEVTAPAPAGLVTILFTDMEGSTTLTQRLGDAAAQELLRTHNSIVREALKAHGGSEIKHTGDGVMASFPSATRALECAVAIQRAFAERNAGVGAGLAPPLLVRIGLNAGEPVAEEADLFGAAVQLAARVCARAEPGRILAANVVRELAMGKGFLFSDQGDVELRGFEDPIRLYEVRWADSA